MIIGHVLLDGIDHAGERQLGSLDGHRPGAGADVPDDVGRLNVELRQGDGADLRLRDEAALGPALREHSSGLPKRRSRPPALLLIGPAWLAFEDHDVERRELHLGNFGQVRPA